MTRRTALPHRPLLTPSALPAPSALALALCVALPGMGNYLVGILKDTPMLSVIGVAELMHTANAIGSESYRFLEPYTLVGVIFLLVSLPTAAGLRRLEAFVRVRLGLTR